MYIAIDDKTNEILGTVNKLKPRTHGIKIDHPEQLTKTITKTEEISLTDKDGNELYKDAHGVISTRKIGKKATTIKTITKQVDILHDPQEFTVDDIRQHAINESKNKIVKNTVTRSSSVNVTENCLLLSDGFKGYIDLRTSKSIGLGAHRAEIATGGHLVLNIPNVPEDVMAHVVIEADGKIIYGAGKSLQTAKRANNNSGSAGKKGLVIYIANNDDRTVVIHAVAVHW